MDKIEIIGPNRIELTQQVRSHVENQIREARSFLPGETPVEVAIGEPSERRQAFFARFRTSFDGQDVVATAIGPDIYSVVRVARSNLQRQIRRLGGVRPQKKDFFERKPRPVLQPHRGAA